MIWLIFALGTLLRIVNLFSQKSFWWDELFSLLLAQKNFWDFLYGTIRDVHPPGHLLILHGIHSLVGDVDWAYRAPSTIAGCLLIWVVYCLTKEIFEKKTALVASLFVAVSPYFMQLSNEARSYSLSTLVITFMAYSFVKFWRTSDVKWRRAYEISAIACLYIDHFTWIWLFMINILLLFSRNFKRFFSSHLRIFLYGLPAFALTAYQSLCSEEKLSIHIKHSFAVFPAVKKILAVLWHAATGYAYSGWTKQTVALYSGEILFWLATAAYVSFLIAALFGLIKAKKDVLLFILFSSLIPMVLICFIYPTRLEARYVSFSVPLMMVLAAAGFSRNKYSLFASLPFVILSLWVTIQSILMPWDPIHREDYRPAVAYAFKTAGPDDAVSGHSRHVFYYGPKNQKADYFSDVTEIDFKRNYDRIFLLEPPLFVDPQLDHLHLDRSKDVLGKFGYHLKESVEFGKDGVHIFVHEFRRD